MEIVFLNTNYERFKNLKNFGKNMNDNQENIASCWFSPHHVFNVGEQLVAICLDGKIYQCTACLCGEYHLQDNEYLNKSAVLCIAQLDSILISTGFVEAQSEMKAAMEFQLKKEWLKAQEWVNDIETMALSELLALVNNNLITGRMVKSWNKHIVSLEDRSTQIKIESSGQFNTLRVIQEILEERSSG